MNGASAARTEIDVIEHRIESEPYYLPIGREVERFEAAWRARLPVLLKGPTGCGKTRFVEHMAWRLMEARRAAGESQLVTVACHEDLTASDLVGKYLLQGEETVWVNGPLTKAVAGGAICYLDEVVEARKDTTVLIHPLCDHRRTLPIEKKGTVIPAHEDFLLVISYNPGYQSVFKNLKPSTRQRFVAIEFDYPPPELEEQVIAHECGIGKDIATKLAQLGKKVRNLKSEGLEEGVSTRLLIYAGKLVAENIPAREACTMALVEALSDDPDVQQAIGDLVDSVFPAGA
ncbi:MAG: MoxR family ATPase [Chrysiogenetes bacterium]|nr:MoxR family ATPase [Chrysiogenetes bacterium]